MTKNVHVLDWIKEMADMTQPDRIVWIDGSEEQTEALRKEAVSTGELIKLNPELLPNCYLHRTAVNDVARVENRTFICTSKKEDAGNINNWMAPAGMLREARKALQRLNEGQNDVCYSLLYGCTGLRFRKDRNRAYRLYICCPQYAHHDKSRTARS